MKKSEKYWWDKNDYRRGSWIAWGVVTHDHKEVLGIAYDPENKRPDIFDTEQEAQDFCDGMNESLGVGMTASVVKVTLKIEKVFRPAGSKRG